MSKAHADDVSTVVGGIDNTFTDIGNAAHASVAQHLHGHDKRLWVSAHDADAVVGGSSDAGAVGAVHVAVGHVVVAINEVPAVEVIDVAVVVIVVGRFALSLLRVAPDVVHKIGMGDVDTRIENGDDGTLRVDNGLVPQHVNVLLRDAILADVEWVARRIRADGCGLSLFVWILVVWILVVWGVSRFVVWGSYICF